MQKITEKVKTCIKGKKYKYSLSFIAEYNK